MDTSKDFSLSIFHALGKFLYNKRINPKTGKPEQMDPKYMKNPSKRPKLYFDIQEVIFQQSMLEPNTFTLYLHQNLPGFFGDICDLADCLETFSHQDNVESQLTYSYSNQSEIQSAHELNAVICATGVLDSNVHCKNMQKSKAGF